MEACQEGYKIGSSLPMEGMGGRKWGHVPYKEAVGESSQCDWKLIKGKFIWDKAGMGGGDETNKEHIDPGLYPKINFLSKG